MNILSSAVHGIDAIVDFHLILASGSAVSMGSYPDRMSVLESKSISNGPTNEGRMPAIDLLWMARGRSNLCQRAGAAAGEAVWDGSDDQAALD